MANLNGFNAHEVEPSSTFDPLPAGKYLAAVTGTEMKATKDGKGSFLNIELTVVEGQYKDRKVWDRLCLNHSNSQTVKIAQGNLSALCRAVGVMTPRDSVELHNIPLVVTVKLKKREDTGELTNEVRGYARKEAAIGKPQQAAPTDNTPPWRR
jgi:hypothetical protein